MRAAQRHWSLLLVLCLGMGARPAVAAPTPAPALPAGPLPAEPKPAEPKPAPAAEPPPEQPPAVVPDTWLDESHEAVSRGLLWTVKTFNHFFADERQVDLVRAGSFVRWRSDLRIRDDGSFAAGTSLLAEVRLPAINERLERLRLTLVAGTAPPQGQLIPGRPQPDAPDRANAGLRLLLHDSLGVTIDTQGGLLFRPIGWWVRLRARQVHPLGWDLVARDALAGFWQTNTGFGTRQDVSLERPLLRNLLARVDGTGTVTQRSRGWEWGVSTSLLASIGPRTAAALSLEVLGATGFGPMAERRRVLARIRHDVLRRWILVELQPEVELLRLETGHVQRARALIVRLELQFDAATLQSGSDAWPVRW